MLAHADSEREWRLSTTFEQPRRSDIESAVGDDRGLLGKYRNVRLGDSGYDDLLTAVTRPIPRFGAAGGAPHEARLKALPERIFVRGKRHRGENPAYGGLVPANLLHLGGHSHVMLVDLSASRLYVYQNHHGLPHLARDYYVSIGVNGAGKVKEGDQRTPVGIYHVTTFLPGEQLPDRYGTGAFPIDYPNSWDRRYRRTGYGIWLHGSPSKLSNRGPNTSDGCVVLSNPDFQRLREFIHPGVRTPVVIADKVEWITLRQLSARQADALSLLEAWRRDWESLNTEKYLSHYSKHEFIGSGKDYETWAKHKRRVNSSKSFVQVRLGVQGLFVYPGEAAVLAVELDQRYFSNNYQGRVQKQQYWRKDDAGRWRVIYEGRG